MKFENSFDVDAQIDEVWKTLLDLERVAPAMPGARVLEQTGDDTYKVAIKVKVGPVTMEYRGDVEIVEKDESSHTAKLKVKAKEARGQGTANAEVTQHLESRDGAGTHATVAADVALSGRAAAMSRGIIEDVSARLVKQFADNLQTMLSGGEEAAPPAEQPTRVEQPTVIAQQPPPPPEQAPPTSEPTPPPAAPAPPPPAAEQQEDVFDAGAMAGSMVADRLRDPKVLAAVIGGALVIGFVLRRALR